MSLIYPIWSGEKTDEAILNQEMNLVDAIRSISEDYGVYFTFDHTLVKDLKVHYVKDHGVSVEQAVSGVLEGTDLHFKFYDQRFIILYKNDREGMESLKEMMKHFGEIIEREEVGEVSRILYPLGETRLMDGWKPDLRKLTGLILNISGEVTDVNGEPLIGVNVRIKGSEMGTATDFDGSYSLNNVNENAIIVFSYIGFQTVEIPLDGRTELSVKLLSDSELLDEVVVVGYGTQKKVNVIGSVSSLSNEDITSSPVSMVSNALSGRLSGTIIQQSSGEPGSDAASILIRGKSTLGNNNPLIVIDGIPGRDLNSIDPQDIESLSVLKDASAAIYGARAANGVILITTKEGKEGGPKLSYNYYHGFSSPTKITEMVDAPTYAQMIREQELYQGIPEENLKFSLEDVEKYKSGEYVWTHPNTDWYSAAIAKNTNIHHHSVAVSGGTKKIQYYGSFGNQFNDGIYKSNATSYNRYNLRLKLDSEINDYIKVGINVNGSQENSMYPTKSASSIFQNGIYRSKPTQHAIFPNGFPGPDVEYGDQPVVTTSFETGFNDTKIYRLENILDAEVKVPFVEGMSLSGFYSYDRYFNVKKVFQKPWTLYVLDTEAYYAAGNTGKEDGSSFLKSYTTGFSEPQVNDFYSDAFTQTLNFKINYNRVFNKIHSLNTFVAYESSEYEIKGINAFRRYFISDQLPYLFAGSVDDQSIGSSVSIDSRMNYFGRISYNYDEKYLAQFSFRRDGSLRFSEDNGRWGNFPSLLLGWRASSEDFWPRVFPKVDYFKLKASWGKLGNDAVDAFQYLTNYKFSTGTVFGLTKSYQTALTQDGVPNPFITWEVANIFNLGFESMFINQKFSLDFEFFHERRNNILIQRNASVPSFTGLELPDENFGIVDVNGFEIVAGYHNVFNKLGVSVNGNFSFSNNKIVEYDEPERSVAWQSLTGHPIGSTLLYKSIGVFDDEEDLDSYPHVDGARPGDIIILDYNNDGEITNDDRVVFDQSSTPRIIYGLDINLSYQNWKLNTLIQGVGQTSKQIFTAVQGKGGTYFQYDADGRWTPDNTLADKPRSFERDNPYWRGSHMTDYYHHDMSYMRLKNIVLSYTIPKRLSNFILLSDAEVYVSAQNLLMLSVGSGSNIMDPELGSISNYPIMKTIAVGLQIKL
ncbi:SusC/RagA family TonB-linked outer membrane protein [Membranihabitans marinus]|uniref:SusC/RagA family TonB-linked outer membrane protein n=1 Tax=Membranihabitans marinus TaxID=1227546 RepID=UPI001F2E1EC9|nr:TonB-dependent receptor [Membranihabitans marinus]